MRGLMGLQRRLPLFGLTSDGDDHGIATAKSSERSSRGGPIWEGTGLHFPVARFKSDSNLAESGAFDLGPDRGGVSSRVVPLGKAAELYGVSRRFESASSLGRGPASAGGCPVEAAACLRLAPDRLIVFGRQQEGLARFFPLEFGRGTFEGSGGRKSVAFGSFQDTKLSQGATGEQGIV